MATQLAQTATTTTTTTTTAPAPLRPCPLCAATETSVEVRTDKYNSSGEQYLVLRCRQCDLLYTRPLPTAAELHALYSSEFYGESVKPKLLSWDSIRLLLHQSVLRHRRKALLNRAPGRVLDVGCGDGDFVAHLRPRGWEVHGVEFSAAGCKLARAKGVQVHQGELKGANFTDGHFDVVTIWHVMEHLADPLAEVTEVRRVLRDDGLLVIEVPNIGSPTFKLCRERWWLLDIPRHLQHYTPDTLQKLLQRAGFTPVYRQNFHLVDFALVFITLMEWSQVLGPRQGDHYFVTDFRQAPLHRKLLFLLLGSVVGLLSFPISALSTLLTSQSETVTMTFRKAAR
ncbi:MAG: class I SAM-dependent methyltransferase [Acidobacteria bacterium]|nr:class I SAM-dependent methyltransferase [Acidobacteriota bacterium]MBI3427417.1 class I SAM-dependent methyltransferase [Acidobacteriota bacterium]